MTTSLTEGPTRGNKKDIKVPPQRPKSGPPAPKAHSGLPKTFLSQEGKEVQVHYKETKYGFEYGAAEITRFHSDPKDGWVMIGIKTPKLKQAMQIYVTKTGKVRVFCEGEWLSPERIEKNLIGKILSKLDKE